MKNRNEQSVKADKEDLLRVLYPLINSYDVINACLCQDEETHKWYVWDEMAMGEAMADLRQAVNNAKVATID